MKRLITLVYRLDLSAQVVAGLGLAFMMVVTLIDILMRILGKPILGAIELICFSGAIVVGFSIPYASWMKSHVYVDLLENRLSRRARTGLQFFNKIVGVLLFLFLGYNFILYGLTLRQTGEVSPGLKIPYYPITFGLAVSCFLESLTLFCDLLKTIQGERK